MTEAEKEKPWFYVEGWVKLRGVGTWVQAGDETEAREIATAFPDFDLSTGEVSDLEITRIKRDRP